MQSAAAVMVRTSSDNTAAMYGFGFGGPDTGSLFEEALKRVQQSLKQTPTPQQPSPVGKSFLSDQANKQARTL